MKQYVKYGWSVASLCVGFLIPTGAASAAEFSYNGDAGPAYWS